MSLRLLEGEVVVNGPIAYVVKGYQHPPGYLVAYPRYNILSRRKLQKHEAKIYESTMYWNCIQRSVPVVPRSAWPYTLRERPLGALDQLISMLESLLEVDLYPTGSSLFVERPNDYDFIIYGADQEVVGRLRKLIDRGVIKVNVDILVREYIEKHSSTLSLSDYLRVKKSTILHGLFQGFHVNFKLVELRTGFNECVDPVISYEDYTGPATIVEALNPHVIPARYRAVIRGVELILESLREIYSELEPGRYWVENARLEHRPSGVHLVPDLGVLRPIT
jgi:hypothetical protein